MSSEDFEYSSLISQALRPQRSGRKRDSSMAFGGGQSYSAAVITPVALLPNSQNPLLTAPDGTPLTDEYTCLDGDEQDASLHDKLMQDPDEGCVFCEHGSCNEHSKAELDQIHAIEEESYGLRSDGSTFKYISDEYKRRIHQPLTIQKNIRDKREGRTTSQPLPEWPIEMVARHFNKDGLYMHREIGSDIRFCSKLQKNLQFHGIAKKTDAGKDIELERAKLWIALSKHKSDLTKTFHSLYPQIAKRQKKNPTDNKPSGAK